MKTPILLTLMSFWGAYYFVSNPSFDSNFDNSNAQYVFGAKMLTLDDFKPAKLERAKPEVVQSVNAAAAGIWDGTSPYLAKAPDMQSIAHNVFDSLETFQQFHRNWVNVETGGNFNLGHTNISHQHDGTPEHNFGIYQINERWGLNNRRGSWGRNSNPWRLTRDDVLYDVEANANIAWNHLIAMTKSPDYKNDFWSALDIYWHGESSNNAYSMGVRAGNIIAYSE